MVRHFVQKCNDRLDREIQGITEEALKCLEGYNWPGNVRELENVIERAITLETTDYIQQERVPEKVYSTAAAESMSSLPLVSAEGFDLEGYLKQVERELILQALGLAEGNQTRAAEILQLSYRSLRHRINTLEIKKTELKK